MNRISALIAPPSRTTASILTAFWLAASRYSSNVAQSWHPGAAVNSLIHGLQVHLWIRSITASKCISTLARSWPPSSHGHGHQVHLQTSSIIASKYIIKERRQVYWDTGVTEVDRVSGSIYSADARVGWHHLISISSCNENSHSIFPNFWSHSHCTRYFVEPHNRMDPQCWVVLYLLTRILPSSNQNCSFSWILFECCERYGGVLMVGSLPSSSIVSPQLPARWCIAKFSQWACPSAPRIILDYHLRPDLPYVYIYRELNNGFHILMWRILWL